MALSAPSASLADADAHRLAYEKAFRSEREPLLLEFKSECAEIARRVEARLLEGHRAGERVSSDRETVARLAADERDKRDEKRALEREARRAADERRAEERERERLAQKSAELERRSLELAGYKAEFEREVKLKYDAFARAKTFYKNRLDVYYATETLPGSVLRVYVQFFTRKKSADGSYTLFLLKKSDGSYVAEGTRPSIPNFDALTRRLGDTGDLPGFICCVRKCFLQIRDSSKF